MIKIRITGLVKVAFYQTLYNILKTSIYTKVIVSEIVKFPHNFIREYRKL